MILAVFLPSKVSTAKAPSVKTLPRICSVTPPPSDDTKSGTFVFFDILSLHAMVGFKSKPSLELGEFKD